MPKPKNNQNSNKTGTVRTRIVRRGPSMTKKKDRLKKLDLESSQQTISQVEKPDEVDEETRRREREEDRRRWLQQQRIKYPVAPDGYIPNSIVRRNLQPHVPRPPEKQPEEKTKLTFLERRLSRLERMNSLDLLGASEFRFIDNASRASSPSLSAVDRDRPSSKKKARSDVVNDVVTQIRQTSPQLTSFLELEDIAEVEPRLEDSASTSTPEGSSSRERDRGKGGERVDEEGRREVEEALEEGKGGEEDGRKEEMESGGSGRNAHHPHHQQEVDSSPQHHDHTSPISSFSVTSVAKQPLINGHQDQTSSTIHPTQENDDNESSSDLKKRRREDEGLEADHVTWIKDGENDVDAISAAAEDAREEEKKDEDEEERDVVGRGGDDGGDLDSYPPSNWKIPLIVEPGDDENDAKEDEQTTREGGEGDGEGRGGEGESAAGELTSGEEHDGNFGGTGSRSDGAPHGDEDEKRSSEVDTERQNGTGGQQDEGQRFDSNVEKEEKEDEQLVKVLVDISLPNMRQLDEEDSAADETAGKTTNGDDKEKVGDPDRDLSLNEVREEKPEVDEDEYGGGRRRRRRMDGRGLNVEDWGDGEPVSPFFSALRPPRLYDDDLDLTSFNSSMAATNASPPVFIELDESENGGEGDKEDGRGNFLNSRSTRNAKDFSSEMGYDRGEREEKEEGEMEGEGQQGEENDNDRYWSSCSNGRLNRRHNHREDDHGSNPSPPLGWHLTWYDRYYQGQGEHPPNTGSSKADHRRGADGTEAGEDGFLPRLLQLSKDERKKRRHHGCEYSILVQKRMHEHISITRYLRTKKLAEILCDFRKPFNPNIIKFQYTV